MRKACSAVAEVKEPNALIDRLAELHGEVWTVNGKQEERISVADIRDHLGLAVVDLVRFQSIGPRIAEAMMALGWTKAKKNLRSHKGQAPTTGYWRSWVAPPPAADDDGDDV
jgi:hypothetical protein